MKKSDWADLPMDILRMIIEKLFWSERLPSCLVCKNWHECFLEIQNEEQFLPWVMTYGGGICKLGDPSAQASRIVEGATHDLLGGAGTVSACDSRYGWVLFLKELDYDDDDYDDEQYILYSPFTNEAIKFPKLIFGHSRQVTFSHNPGSPGCMIISFSIQCQNLCIKTCHPDDKSWKIFKFGGGYKYDFIVALACAVDFVYCVFADREIGLGWHLGADLYLNLGAFNIKQQDWKVFPGFLPKKNSCFRSLTVAFNGDILLQTVCSDRRQLQFWKFDLSKEKWAVVEDEIMKKHVIFTGCGTSFTVPAVRDARQSAGMVYSFDNCSYFLDSSCFPFDVNPTSQTPEIHHRWLNGDYKWLNEDYNLLEKIWIQPPLQRISR